MEISRERDERNREEDPILRKTVFTFLGVGVLLVYLAVIYFFMAVVINNFFLSILGVIGIIASLVIVYRLSQKFITYSPR